jgi:hypothetical protein
MPKGKPAGIRCIQLTTDNLYKLFGLSSRPAVCSSLKPSKEMCHTTKEEAMKYLLKLEEETSTNKQE